MRCPRCDHPRFVFSRKGGHFDRNSRVDAELNQTRRERECKGCGHRWITVEVALGELQTLRAAAFRDNMKGLAS